MKTIKFFRETALPATTVPDSIYIVAPSTKPNYVELYVTNSTNQIRRIINEDDIKSLINTAVSAATELIIVDDIAARDALTLTQTRYVYVKDATGDPTVSSGGATYLYDPNATAPNNWIKVSESESLDVQLTWAALQNKPTSSVADIDDAVTKRHSHTNKTQLDKISEDSNGEMLYNSNPVLTRWETTAW